MYPVSQAFKDALKRSHKIVTKAEVWDSGQLVRTLQPLSGQVTVDATASYRRRCHVTLTDPDGTLTPSSAADILAPYGNELRLYRGLVLTTFTETTATAEAVYSDAYVDAYGVTTGSVIESTFLSYVPLGVFGIADVEVNDTGPELTIEIAAFDRARKVSRNRWTAAYVISDGTNYATAIKNAVTSRLPGTTFNFMNTTRTTPQLVFGETAENDPWKDLQAMAQAIGAELFFDADGICILRPVPDPTTDASVWTYAEGSEAIFLNLTRTLTDELTYNHVVVSGESTAIATPVRAEAKDTDPASPTYYLGDYGDVPFFISSPLITTEAQAQDAADAKLRQVLGTTEQLQFNSIVNPAHEVGDVIDVIRERAKVNARYVIESMTVPIVAIQAMPVTTRKREV